MHIARMRLLTFTTVLAVSLLPLLAGASLRPLDLDIAARLVEEAGGLDEYPNANSIVVLDHTDIEFEESGAYEQYNHVLVKILTDEGLDDHGDISVSYHRGYGTVDILMARVIKADGREVPVGQNLITDGTPPGLSAMDIYETDFREKTVVFPNLEIGDAIEYLTLQDYEPLLKNGFNGIYFLQDKDPIVEISLTIRGPHCMPLKHVVKNGEVVFEETLVSDSTGVPESGETAKTLNVYSWRTAGVAQIEPEPRMVSPMEIATRVIVSTMHDWKEMSRYAWKMSDEKCVVEESVSDLVAELTEGLSTTEEKIRAIHYWIIKNVRYLGIAMDRGAFIEPHYAAYTLEKEYGVCRDKAVLMVTMFKQIGVPSWVVFINPGHRTDTEVPNLFFAHGIVAIEAPDGDYLYIDPTDEASREVYATYPGDRWVLLATEEGSGIRRVRHSPAIANSGQITDLSILADDGRITGSVTVTGGGIYEEALRAIARNVMEARLEMMWEEMIHGLYPGANLVTFEVSDCEDLHEPVSISFEYEIADYALDADPYVLFKVPAATGQFDVISTFLLGPMTTLPQRKYAVNIGAALGTQEEAETAIPPGYLVKSLPDEVHFAEGPVALDITYDFVPAGENDGKALVRYRRVLALESFALSPQEYLSLKEALRLASRSTRGEIILMAEEG